MSIYEFDIEKYSYININDLNLLTVRFDLVLNVYMYLNTVPSLCFQLIESVSMRFSPYRCVIYWLGPTLVVILF